MRNTLRFCLAIAPAVALCLAFSSTAVFSSARPAPAPLLTGIVVNTTSDAANGTDGLCTLREAIGSANADMASSGVGGECAAGSGTDTISFSVTGTINLTGALPAISSNLTITGPGSGNLTVRRDTGGNYRIFTVSTGATAGISGLTVTNGRTPDGDPANIGSNGGDGGGVLNSGTLTLTDVTVTANVTGAGGAGTSIGGRGGSGGGVYNSTSSTLTMTNCTVTNNSAGAGGTGNNGGGDGGSGGGVLNQGTLSMTSCVVNGNTTGRGGDCPSFAGRGGDGGGVLSMLNMADLNRVTITNNTAGDSGTGNGGFGGMGGGIMVRGASTMTLTNSTVSGNKSGNSATGTNGFGGGVMNNGALFVSGSTFSGNTTGGPGGGLMNQGVGALKMVNSTVSANLAGNGVQDDSSTTLTLTNCTLTGNAPFGVLSASNNAVVRNTLIAGNGSGSGPDVSGTYSSQGHNLIGNADGSAGFISSDMVGSTAAPINPRLGSLANNGGPTLTHALLAGSPALDAGDNALALDNSNAALTTDQRGTGFPRIADAADADTTQTVDIGAFEAHPTVQDILNQTTNEDTALSINFNVGDATLGISSVTASSGDTTLFPNDTSHVSVTGSGSTRTLTLTPAANLSGLATITVTVTATNGQTATDTFQVTVAPVNDTPTLDALGDLTINEDANTHIVTLTGISAGAGEVQTLTVTASSNNTTLIPNPTVTYTSPSATGTISFAPVANQSGTAIITVTVTDNGGTANGGINTISRTFNVTVNAVNDAPVNTVPGAQTTAQHTPRVFSAANSNAISVADIDAGTDAIKVTLTASNGTVTLGSTAGLSFVTGDGTDDASVSFNGTVTAINTALNGVSFKPAQGFSGAASLQIVTDDLGHNGSGGALSDTDSISITVNSGGAFRFSSTLIGTQENVGTATILVTRTGGSAGAATVDYATAFSSSSVSPAVGGATCTGNVDYISAAGTLSFADGETSKSISIDICDDSRHEVEDTFTLILSNPTGSGVLGTVPQTFIVIVDNDPVGGVINFAQSSYNVAEGGTLTVTVRRTSDTTQAAGVDYATDDGSTPSVAVPCASTTGIALDRCDFTKALGTLSFAPGETEKTFKLLVNYDVYDEGPETLTLRLSNPTGGAALGTTSTATVTLADLHESVGNPLDDTTKFVTQHYRDFLNRDPDASGLAFWVQGIDSCGADAGCREVKRIDTSAAFFLSIEFQNTGYLVERTYKTAYGDTTSPNVAGTVPIVRLNEFLNDTQRIGRDVIVGQGAWAMQIENNKNFFMLEFVQRQRFVNAYPASLTAAQFVDGLAQNAGVTLSQPERDGLISMLGATPSDASKRAQVLRAVAEHQQLRENEFNRAFVLMQYFGYLRRNPDDAPETNLNFAGWKFWLGKLEEFGGDYRRAEMVKAFLNSDEYRRRFGPQ